MVLDILDVVGCRVPHEAPRRSAIVSRVLFWEQGKERTHRAKEGNQIYIRKPVERGLAVSFCLIWEPFHSFQPSRRVSAP